MGEELGLESKKKVGFHLSIISSQHNYGRTRTKQEEKERNPLVSASEIETGAKGEEDDDDGEDQHHGAHRRRFRRWLRFY